MMSGQKSKKVKVSTNCTHSRSPEEENFLASPGFCCLSVFLDLCPQHPSLCLCGHIGDLPCWCATYIGLYSVLLNDQSIFILYHMVLIIVGLQCLEILPLSSFLDFFIFYSKLLWLFQVFCIYMDLKISFSTSTKHAVDVLIGMTLKICQFVENHPLNNIKSFPLSTKDSPFNHISFLSVSNVLNFSVYRSCTFVRFSLSI